MHSFFIWGVLWTVIIFQESSAFNVWVADYESNSASNFTSYLDYKTISCREGPRESVHLPDRNYLVIAESGNNSLGIVDLATFSLLNRIELPGEPRGLSYQNETKTLFGVLKDKNQLFSLNTVNNKVSLIETLTSEGPRNTLIDDKTKTIWVSCNIAHMIDVYDLITLEKKISIPTCLNPYALIAIEPGIVAVSSIGENVIEAFKSEDYKRAWKADSGAHPTAITQDEQGFLYVTNFDSGEITVLSKDGKNRLNSIYVGKEPFGIVYDSGKLFVSCHGENTLKLVDTRTGKVVSQFKTGLRPHGVTLIKNGF